MAFLVHKDIPFSPVVLDIPPSDCTTEALAIDIDFNNTPLRLVNLYFPPSSSCPAGYSPTLLPFLSHPDSVVMGDINAHDPLWYSNIEANCRGRCSP